MSDPDGETDLALRVTVGNAAAGVVTGTGGTSVTNEGGGVFSVGGSFDATTIDTALDNLRFSPTDNTGDSGTFNTDLTVQVNDQESGFVDVSGPATVTVTRINDAPTVALGSTSGSIDENNSPPTVLTSITVSDPDGGTNNLSLSGADAGSFQIDGSDLEFTATADFETKSSYDVTVEVNDPNVGSDPDDSESFSLAINDANDPPTVATNTGSSTDEGTDDTILQSELAATDPEEGPAGLTYTIDVDVSEGQLYNIFTSAQLDNGDTFTQEDLNDGLIEYQHDGTEPAGESFAFTVRDRDGGSASATFSITINPVNDAPTVATNQALSVNENASATLTSGLLEATDPDDSASNLSYTIDTDVQNGQIVNTNGPTQLNQGATFTQEDVDKNRIEYRHDGSETTADSFTFDLTDDEGAGPTGVTFSISVAARNDAPTISGLSDPTIEEDATLSALSFTVDDPETSDLSTLSLSGSSDNTTLVPNSNISFTGPDASGTASITADPAANESGTATITITVDDGAAANNTASEQFTLTVTAVPDLAITDGTAGGLNFTADVEPGTSDNPVGTFSLSAGQSGAAFEAVTVQTNASGIEGISAARLYWSSDQTLEPGTDDQLGSEVSVDASGAPSTISFSGFSQSVPTSPRYAILAIDVEEGASGEVRLELLAPGDLSTPGGEIATVNGNATDSFMGLLLSSEAAALPVEMAGFEVQASGGQSVNLRWQTVSETGNAGFHVEREREDESWMEVGFVESQAEGGTTTEAQRYRFVDTDMPFDADSLTYRLRQVDTDGTASYTEPVTIARSAVEQVRLLGTFPNPARSWATVRFAVPDGSAREVTLRLYDVLGREVRTVAAPTEAGRHELQLDTDGLPSGVHFLRLRVGSTVKTQRLTVVR